MVDGSKVKTDLNDGTTAGDIGKMLTNGGVLRFRENTGETAFIITNNVAYVSVD